MVNKGCRGSGLSNRDTRMRRRSDQAARLGTVAGLRFGRSPLFGRFRRALDARHLQVALRIAHPEEPAHEGHEGEAGREALREHTQAVEPAGDDDLPAALEPAIADARDILRRHHREELHITGVLGARLRVHRRGGRTRRKRRDLHARAHGLVGKRAGEREHERLGGGVCRLIGDRHEAFHRGDVEHAALPPREHARQETAREVDHGLHVEIDDLPELRRVRVLEEAGGHQRGVVDEDVGVKAEAPQRGFQLGAALRSAEVAGEHPDANAMGLGQRSRRRGELLLIARDQDEGVPVAGELLGQSPADALRRPGNDDGRSERLPSVWRYRPFST